VLTLFNKNEIIPARRYSGADARKERRQSLRANLAGVQTMEKAFHVPGQPWVIDFAFVRADGVTVSELQGFTLEEVQARHPGAIITFYREAIAEIEASCKTEPRQIGAEDFEYALNVLPRCQWARGDESDSFKMSERTNRRITAIYARVGATYWRFEDVCTMPHTEIITKVRKALESQ
jgi:hypothetical protein